MQGCDTAGIVDHEGGQTALRPHTRPLALDIMLSARPSRYRSSTSASSTPLSISKAVEVLQKLLDGLSSALSKPPAGYPDTIAVVLHLGLIQQHLSAVKPPSPVQDDFRHLHGFQRLFDALRAFSGFYNPQKRTIEEKEGLFSLLGAVLAVLSAAFNGHAGNRRYFRDRVESGGWVALEQTIASIGLGGSDLDAWTSSQLFGKLLAFALDNPALDQLCRNVGTQSPGCKDGDSVDAAAASENDAQNEEYDVPDSAVHIEDEVRRVVKADATIRNPEVIRTIVDFWIPMPKGTGLEAQAVSRLVLSVIAEAIAASSYNLCLVYETAVYTSLLALVLDEGSGLSKAEHNLVVTICRSLMRLGIRSLADAQTLLTSPSPEAAEYCSEMAQNRDPPFVQFDLTLRGHSSIDLPNLGRPFPPLNSVGYTFTAWIRVDKFDPKAHTTLFGVFDQTQTCFLLLYLERDTHSFILQTSVTSQRPSVRFKRFTFQEGRWYHIALVHRRPKTLSASKATLFVDGEFTEELRATYPSPPPLSNGSTESFSSFTSSNNKTMPVQAFVGTPRDLTSARGPGLALGKLSVATAHLFDDVLSEDYLSVPSRLGPRYQGNFQDCLGAFQTYEASATLGLRNDLVTAGREDSDLIKVIRDKASYVVSEQHIMLSLMPSAILREEAQLLDSQLFRALSRGPSNNLMQMTIKSGRGIAINSALPCINDALLRSSGVAVFTGEPIVAIPQRIDDAMWQLAGFTPLALKLIERTTTAEALVRTVEMVFRCVNSSWRNSEAMEKGNGYNIIGMLLKAKLGLGPAGSDIVTERLPLDSIEKDRLSFQLLSLVLEFIGYNHQNSLESVIQNPLAYRILLVDFDVWRKCVPIVQELYYKQFVTFAVESKFHQYNNRRLLRMRKSPTAIFPVPDLTNTWKSRHCQASARCFES